MKDVLLINPPLHFSKGVPHTLERTGPHLGLLYMAAWVHRHSRDFRVRYLDPGPERIPLRDLGERVRSLSPFVVGISVATFNLQGAVELAMHLRKVSPGTTLFAGGPHLTLDPGFALRNPGLFDHCILGEAEQTFLDSLQRLAAGETLPLQRVGDPVSELDALPFPERTLTRRSAYHPADMVLFSRGCRFPCYFCSASALRVPIRHRSVDNLLTEITELVALGRRRFLFSDDTFTRDRQLVIDFCRALRRRGMQISWQCGSRVDSLDEELLIEMARAGCHLVGMGVESGSARVRREIIRKGSFTNQDLRRVVTLCHRHGMRAGAYFILGHPTESADELRATREMILGYDFDGVSVQLLLPYPGTGLYDIARSEGVINEEIIDRYARKELGEGYGGAYPIYVPPGLDLQWLKAEMGSLQRRFYLNPRVAWRTLLRDGMRPSELLLDLRQLLSLVRSGGSVLRPYTYRK